MGMNDEFALMQCATTTQIAAIPFENKVELLIADCLSCGLDGFLDPAVDDNKCGIDEPRMDWRLIPSHPEHVRKREVLEAGKFVE